MLRSSPVPELAQDGGFPEQNPLPGVPERYRFQEPCLHIAVKFSAALVQVAVLLLLKDFTYSARTFLLKGFP